MYRSEIHFLFVRSELGGEQLGASLGIQAIKFAALNSGSEVFNIHPQTKLRTTFESILMNDPLHRFAHQIVQIAAFGEVLRDTMQGILSQGQFPVIVSGDHSSAGALIAGVKKTYPESRVGVIWIDGHADLHTPYTTPSGNMHGMPVAMCLGLDKADAYGTPNPVARDTARLWKQMIHMSGQCPCVLPQDVCIIGLRSFEAPELALIHRRGVHVYTTADLDRQGVDKVAASCLDDLKHCDKIFISFDLDSLDMNIAPGVGTPTPGGLSLTQAKSFLRILWNDSRTAAFEFTEINPLLDTRNQTAILSLEILEHLMAE